MSDLEAGLVESQDSDSHAELTLSSTRTVAPSYRSYVDHMAARNPSLTALSHFLCRQPRDLYNSTVSYIEIGQGGHAGQYQEITCSELVSRANLGLTKGFVAVIENLHPCDVETLGSSWDLDPFFFCGHVASLYEGVEDGQPPPLMALLPSRIATQQYLNLHYQKVVDLGDDSIVGHLPYKLAVHSNIPRTVRRLPGLSRRTIGLVRSCLSVLKKTLSNGTWICLIPVDPTTANIIPRKSGTDTPCENTEIRIPQAPRRINVEDFRELPTYSAFRDSGGTDSDVRDPNMRKDLLLLFRDPPPSWNAGDPGILSLVYYPVKVVTAEWILYSLLMGRYVKFYEYSFPTARSQVSRLEDADVEEFHRWRRRGQQSLLKLERTREFVEYWGEKSPAAIWNQLATDIRHQEEQIKQHASSLETLSSINASLVQLIDSRKSISQAEDVKRLSFVALVFIPLSFVAGIFSIAERYGPGGDDFWIFWATAVPVTIVVLCFSLMTSRIPWLF